MFSSIDLVPEILSDSLLCYVDDVLVLIGTVVYIISCRKDVDNGEDVKVNYTEQSIYSSIIRNSSDISNMSNSKVSASAMVNSSLDNNPDKLSDNNNTDDSRVSGNEDDKSDIPEHESKSKDEESSKSSETSNSEETSVYNTRGVYRDEDELFAERQRKCRPEGLIIEEGTPIW